MRTGRVYTTGAWVDPDGTFLHLLRMLDQMDIGVFAGNHEFSPSQYEINLWHSEALHAADRTFLFKTAIKDIVARTGKLATFLGRPWNDEGGSGFHLHFSVVDAAGKNLMHTPDGALSETANQLIAGILENAPALVSLTNPDHQRVQAPGAGHPRPLPGELGPRQPQHDAAGSAGARLGNAGSRSGWATARRTRT